MTKIELATTTAAISKAYNDLASEILDRISADLENNKITFEHFMSIRANIVTPLIIQSTKIVIDGAINVSNDIADKFSVIKKRTAELKNELDKIKKTQNVINIAAMILTSAALVATFVAAPNLISAASAVSSITGLVSSLKPKDEEEETDEDAADEAV